MVKNTSKTTKTVKNTSKNSTKTSKTTRNVKKVEQKESVREHEVVKTKIKNTAGRPPKMTTKKLIAAAYEYMETTEIPNITEFALKMGYERQYLYERADIEKRKGKPALSDTIKKISQMKEIQLEKLAILGLCPPNFAIFALKQLGWTDKVEEKIEADVEHSGGVLMLAPRIEE